MYHADYVNYQCGMCQKVWRQLRSEPLYQCVVCAIPLCPDCDYDGVCHSHYQCLKPADKDILATFAEKEETIRSRSCFLLMIIYLLAGLGGGFLGVVILNSLQPYPHFDLPLLITGVILLIGAIVVYYYRSQLTTQREVIKITVEGILRKYPELAAIMEKRSGMMDEENPPIQDDEP